jgi:hypothetical protein
MLGHAGGWVIFCVGILAAIATLRPLHHQVIILLRFLI